MIILRFGSSGRLAKVCETAVYLTRPSLQVFTLNRTKLFSSTDGSSVYHSINDLIKAHPGEPFLVVDASVDHSSTSALVDHENFKRDCISILKQLGLLWRCVGFSSGIVLMEPERIQKTASHMLEYRHQKILQESFFSSLDCPVFVPQLFTLVGSYTFKSQSAAWARILRARIDRAVDITLDEPQSRRAWVSEFEVFRCLLEFLSSDRPNNVNGPLVDGEFTLAEIARSEELPLPVLNYGKGQAEGWLRGDYLPPMVPKKPKPLSTELLRVLNS